MALIKWNKYSIYSDTVYFNDRSTGSVHVWRYANAGSNLYGYPDWSFDQWSGYSETGSYGSYPSVFSSSSTSLYWETISLEGETYYVDRYLVRECDSDTTYSRGSFIEEVTAEAGTYPDDGMYGSYWYVKVGVAFPSLQVKVNGANIVEGWVKIDGSLKKIADIWVKVGGSAKKAL